MNIPTLVGKCVRRAISAGCLTLAVTSVVWAVEFTARIGHLESDWQSRHVHLVKVAELVKERTGGAVEFQIFPSAQLGNQREMIRGVQLGTIQATVSPAAFIGDFNPAVSILDIPFLLPADADEAQKLREGAFGAALLETFASKGVVGVSLWPNGLKNFTSNKPLDDLSSFKGQKFRIMDSKILTKQFEALGASAIALPFAELYDSLQSGVVDGQENPLDTIRSMKLNEVQNYLVVSEHGAIEDVALFNPIWWNSIPDAYRKIIKQAFAEVVPALREHKAKAVAVALEEMKAGEINVRVASDEERSALREKVIYRAKAAYIDRTGEAGKQLLSAYEKAIADLN
ncbi:MAG: TRAP transporter substrate-binding protein [Rhizobiaceae bacterium]